MKKKGFFIVTLMIILLFTLNVFADSIDSASNYFASDEDVNISKEILGDIYSVGRTIKVNDKVEGDIIVAGETIDINSKEVSGNIRTASRILNINSKNIKNITSVAQNINIDKETIANGIYVSAEKINFKGSCNGFYANGSTVIINGKIDGNLKVNCDELIIADNGEVTGEVQVYSPKEPITNSKISMSDIKYTKVDNSKNENELKALVGFSTIISLLASLILGFVIYTVSKKFFIRTNDLLIKEPLPVVLGGMASFILVPIVSLLLFITVAGLPLGILSLIIYFIIVYLSPVVMGIILGRLILKHKNPYLQLFVGILVVRLLSLLPMVGAFVWVVSAMIVQGFIVYESYQSIKYKENRI